MIHIANLLDSIVNAFLYLLHFIVIHFSIDPCNFLFASFFFYFFGEGWDRVDRDHSVFLFHHVEFEVLIEYLKIEIQ